MVTWITPHRGMEMGHPHMSLPMGFPIEISLWDFPCIFLDFEIFTKFANVFPMGILYGNSHVFSYQ